MQYISVKSVSLLSLRLPFPWRKGGRGMFLVNSFSCNNAFPRCCFTSLGVSSEKQACFCFFPTNGKEGYIERDSSWYHCIRWRGERSRPSDSSGTGVCNVCDFFFQQYDGRLPLQHARPHGTCARVCWVHSFFSLAVVAVCLLRVHI